MRSLKIDECGADALSSFFPKKYAAAVPFAAALYLVKNRDMNGTALSLLANIAPLCELLGTVTGLMAAFDQIQKLGGAVNISALAGGIWSAMITTATGLLAAIPALVAVRLFERDFLSAWTM